MNRETLTLSAPELRFADEQTATFTGYAALFDDPNSYGEVIQRGAFSRSLSEHRERGSRPSLFWGHNPNEPIGVWDSLAEDEKGLKASGRLITETTRGREAHALLKAGAINGLSIGFRARNQKRGPNGVRVLTDIELVEISLVSLPAAQRARVTDVRASASAEEAAQFIQAVRRAADNIRGKAR